MGTRAGHRHWYVFADDTGDTGDSGGSPHFGYALVAVERTSYAEFTKHRLELRLSSGHFGESKVKSGHSLFAATLGGLRDLHEAQLLLAGGAIIQKDEYTGPYLRADGSVPQDSTFLRHFMLRHAIELVFSDSVIAREDHCDVVIDRYGINGAQITNLRNYLNSKFATYGSFKFPSIEGITIGDSAYIEGIQVAHHLSTLLRDLRNDDLPEGVLSLAREFFRAKTVVGSRPVDLAPEAQALLNSKVHR